MRCEQLVRRGPRKRFRAWRVRGLWNGVAVSNARPGNRNCAVCGFVADQHVVKDVVGRLAHRACVESMRTLVGGFPE